MTPPPPSMIGRELGQYRVVEAIGSGGMGVVYRARDRKLERDVALKVLPAGALADESARKRFRKEALALSRLSHPHVAALFDFDTSEDGIDFLVTELVTGPSLDTKLKHGALPQKEVVKLGAQIVRALVAAHEHGIVHRDLKPGNVKLTDDGLVKVLDFGLARMAPAAHEETTDTVSGNAAGTPPYMSPEQLLGEDVDERTDVYAAGVVLFEMATGRRPFGEASGPQLVAKILSEPMPVVREVNAHLSPQLEFVILKATDKDRELRHQTAKELLVDLERLAAAPAASESARGGPHGSASGVGALSRRRLGAALAGLALVVVAAGTVERLDRPSEPRIGPMNVLARVEPNGLETDGSDVYYSTKFSTKGPLMAVSIEGGQPRSIPLPWQEDVHLSSLHRDPTVLLVRHGTDLWRVPLNAAPTRLEGLSAVAEASWSPRADRLAWIEDRQGSQVLWVGDGGGGNGKRLAEVSKGTDARQALSRLAWHPSGRSLSYFDRPRRFVVEVDVDGTLRRELPYAPLSDLWSTGAAWTPDGRFMVGGSQHGLLLWRARGFGRWRSLDDVPTRLGGPTHVFTIRSTPDGKRFVAFVFRPSAEVFRLDPSSGTAGPSLLDGTRAWTASYSPDGSHLAWVSADLWPGRLWVSGRDGSERLALGDTDVRPLNPLTWSPDGRWIAFSTDRQRAAVAAPFRLQLASLAEGTVQPLTLEDPDAAQVDACWSPDGRWLAYGVEGPFDEKESPYLRRVDLATRHVARLEGSEGLWSPRCAPDGRILAMDWPAQAAEPRSLSTAARRAHFRLRDPATGQWTPLSVGLPAGTGTNAYRVLYPSWSPDGRHVYANLDGRWLVRFEVGSGRLEIVRDMTGLSGWPGTMTLDPDGNPLVTRDMTDREIVVMDIEYR